MPSHNSRYYYDHFDRFGDNYTTSLDIRELNEIISAMGDTNYPIDEELMKDIGFKYSRSDKISICFGVKELQKVKLRFNGNKIVDSFD